MKNIEKLKIDISSQLMNKNVYKVEQAFHPRGALEVKLKRQFNYKYEHCVCGEFAKIIMSTLIQLINYFDIEEVGKLL